MGEATMQCNGVAMVHRHGQGAWIGPAFEQRQRGVLHLQIFTVQPWHQPELTPWLARFGCDPSLQFGAMAQGQCLSIPCKRLGLAPLDVPRKLIQNQNEGQAGKG